MKIIMGRIPSDSDNESSAIELLKQAELEQGLEQVRERARAEGRQQGALQTAQQIAISIAARRFPELEPQARATISTISDLSQLQKVAIELSVALDEEKVKQLLLSLPECKEDDE
jgi:hypothetical protein